MKKILYYSLLLLLMGVFGYSGFRLYGIDREYKAGKEAYEKLQSFARFPDGEGNQESGNTVRMQDSPREQGLGEVINLISKPEGLTRGGQVEPGSTHLERLVNGPRLEEFLAEMNREAGLTRLQLLTVGEMPGSTIEIARRVTDPQRAELTMVFTFEHMGLDQAGDTKWEPAPLWLPALKQNLARWQEGLAGIGWNSLYLNNHDQPRSISRMYDISEEQT